MSTVRLRCRVLGVPRVEADGQHVGLGSPLAMQAWFQLVAARGRRVTDDQLVDALWPEEPPPTATATLRAYVSRLRRILDPEGRGVVVRELGGYRAPVEVVTTDAEDFTRDCAAACAEPDPARRAERLTTALAAWEGEAYEGLPDRGWVADERARLVDALESARLALLRAVVDRDGGADVLPELRRRVQQRPSDEATHELLALALYRSGRQADALEALRQARETLVDGWGLDVGPRLARLETAVLRQDAALDVPVPPAGAAATVVLESPDRGSRAEQDLVGPGAPTRSVPLPLSSFVGRDAELDAVRRALDHERVVTLVAVGGTGKTRLALETARWWVADDGPWFVDLGPLHDPALLADTVATTVGLLPGSGTDAVVAALAERSTVLVLDNCEHLVDALVPFLARVLESCPGVQVLATSRVPLGVEGECAVRLGPLDPAGDAVELFCDRASSAGARPDDLADLEAVTAVCRRVDGHPLAVELVARQCRLVTVPELSAHLDDRAALLGQARPAHARGGAGRSLGEVIAWSVDRLEEPERELFWSLSVFDGGFDLSAADAVGAGPGLVPGLLALLDVGLVQVSDGPTGRRYRVLETLRDFAAQHAPATALADARSAHVRWVCDLVRAAGAQLRGPQARVWSERLEVEQANVRSALSAAIEDADGPAARLITGEVGWFWFRRAHVAEGLRWCRLALSLPHPEVGGVSGSPGPTSEDPQDDAVLVDARATARTQLAAGLLSYLAGLFEQLAGYGAEAVTWGERCGDVQTVAASLAYQSYLLAYAGRPDDARALSEAAEGRARESAPSWTVAEVLMLRGQLLRATGDPEGARLLLGEAADLARLAGHDWCEGSALWNAGKSAWDTGDVPAVTTYAAASARVQHDAGDLTSWLVSLHMLAGAAALSGRGREAARLLGAVGAHAARLGFAPEVMDPLDSPRQVAAVESGLPPEELAAALAEGSELGTEATMALVDAVAPEPRAT